VATKDIIIAQIQIAADATSLPRIRAGLGAPGDHVEIEGQRLRTGIQWEANPNDGGPSPTEVQVEGIAAHLDSMDVAAIKAKVNELVGGYMQLKADYNNGVVPTTALDVVPLP